jgi:hypothetical protein
MFNKLVLQQLPMDFYENTGIQRLLEDAIGLSNKMVLMTNTGRVQIYNEPLGEWSDGIWYSNSGYKYKYVYTSPKQHKHYAHNSRISVNDCEQLNVDEYDVEDLTNDSMEEWSSAYAAAVYPGLFVCLTCGDNIGNASLSTGICMKCNEPLIKDLYDTSHVCEYCYSVSVESFDRCPVCDMNINPYKVKKGDEISLSLIKNEYSPYKRYSIVLSIDKCIICKTRKTMFRNGFKQHTTPDYEYKNYCMTCYYDKSSKQREAGVGWSEKKRSGSSS